MYVSPQHIKAGEGIIAATQSGNRDEDVFPDPDVFNMHRKRGSEMALGYGYGEHLCVAEGLARTELEVVFCKSFWNSSYPYISVLLQLRYPRLLTDIHEIATLFQRLPNLKLGIPQSEVKYSPPDGDVGITELPVVW